MNTPRPPAVKPAMTWVYSVAFKHPRGTALVWVLTTCQDVTAASMQARELIAKRHPNAGLIEYGHSRTEIAP